MPNINTPETVKEQYKTSDNLVTRISIHEKYSANKQGFGNWIFTHYDIPANAEILELGCGTGSIWKGKLDLLSSGARLLLTDISEGMISAAKQTLGAHKNISYGIADIEALPYDNGCFDIVIANMMLYHVPDLDKGLSEVRRVLSEGGYFYCATFGENGIAPYISGLLKDYGVTDATNKNFTLQNGQTVLTKYFSDVKRFDYEDHLEVTDIEDILDYIYSLSGILSTAGLERAEIKRVLEKNAVNGVLYIPKENGMFVCRKNIAPPINS